ncbi:MAG: cupin domain-containing protein [Lachnospiraceae bacterium]|nr:cupin domain-containing protein [Lachnospiraceae bacterium]MDY4968696.1 cupin domain-containing protein [Lachnospiraceae bacterium]
MNCSCRLEKTDHGPDPYVMSVEQAAMKNRNFRTAVWTGCHLQMTLMCIPPCGEIGLEIHEDTDQYIRVEMGRGAVRMGKCKNQLNFQQNLCRGDGIFIAAGTWHNIINTGRSNLKVSSVYAPPHHPRGTVHFTKEDAAREERG